MYTEESNRTINTNIKILSFLILLQNIIGIISQTFDKYDQEIIIHRSIIFILLIVEIVLLFTIKAKTQLI